jgi:chlorite dismutase
MRWSNYVDAPDILLRCARSCFVHGSRIPAALLPFSGFGTFEALRETARGITISRARAMTDTKENVPRGVRPNIPKRPAMDADAWGQIQAAQEKMKEREYIRFSVFKVDPAWRRLSKKERVAHKDEFESMIGARVRDMMIYSYALVATRGDADFLLWQASRDLGQLHELATALNQTGLSGYLSQTHSYFSMTKRSIYLNRYEEEYVKTYGGEEVLDSARIAVNPQGSQYLFVYPMAKSREWYKLPHEDRQRMMDEHIRVGHQWPDVKLNTTYSYGLDDQEFVVAFESDHPGRFLDLLMALRHTEASAYTLFDVPAFTGLARSMMDTLDSVG